MRKVLSIILIVALASSLGACAREANICGTTYTPYGLLNENDKKNPDIEYEVVWGNVFWGIVLMGTIVAPIYFGGFSLFQPVGPKPRIKGAINQQVSCSKE